MGTQHQFDVVIIGAGPAGIACSLVLAKNGYKTLMIERALRIGGKNLTGGRLYSYALELVEAGLTAKAALERKVVREQIMLLGKVSGTTVDYYQPDPKDAPQSYTVLRANFDEWFATYAEKQGVVLIDGIKVDNLIEKDGKVIGIQAGDDIVYSNIVIAADGVNSLFAEQAGLRKKLLPTAVGIGVKEVISLPAKTIEARFGLKPGEGASRVIIGGTNGVIGGGFLYTNKESVSLGLVLSPHSVAKQNKKIYEILQDFKMHPAISPLVGDGETIEYGAHMVPEAGWGGLPANLYRDGFLLIGDAAGFVINSGTTIRGIDLAIISGVAAANAIILSHDNKTAVGPAYMQQLKELNLLPAMKLFAAMPEITHNPRMSATYPEMVNAIMNQMFAIDNNKPEKLSKAMWQTIRQHVSLSELLSDGWKGVRAL